MVAYFVRRLVGGLTTLVLSSLILYSILVYFPGGVMGQACFGCGFLSRSCLDCISYDFREKLVESFELEEPWPANYVSWLFDTRSPSERYFGYDEAADLSVTILGIRVEGSGVLAGDLGQSLQVERGATATDLFGPGLGELLLATTAAIFLLMAIATAQRQRHPPAYSAAANPQPFTTERIRWLT